MREEEKRSDENHVPQKHRKSRGIGKKYHVHVENLKKCNLFFSSKMGYL